MLDFCLSGDECFSQVIAMEPDVLCTITYLKEPLYLEELICSYSYMYWNHSKIYQR